MRMTLLRGHQRMSRLSVDGVVEGVSYGEGESEYVCVVCDVGRACRSSQLTLLIIRAATVAISPEDAHALPHVEQVGGHRAGARRTWMRAPKCLQS